MAKKKQTSKKVESAKDDFVRFGGTCLNNDIDFGVSAGSVRSFKPESIGKAIAMLERIQRQDKENK